MALPTAVYAARLDIDYPSRLDRFTTFLRPILVLPTWIILCLLPASGVITIHVGERTGSSGVGFIVGLAVATALMIVFRQRYPRWWFEFARELLRFAARILAYLLLLTDRYPSTVEE